ncbi:MAG: carbohydrate-binding protein [Clostridiales bacterium]|jgi:hypothetical protein|nr:carbohydrate-binding protein [Clostridiales bacterium]
MNNVKLAIVNGEGLTLAEVLGEERACLIYNKAYNDGDAIRLELEEPGFCQIRLEDSMLPAPVYIKGKAAFTIPFGEKRQAYSPKSFTGDTHMITARLLTSSEISARRNLAFNPYDLAGTDGALIYPHASANIETRGEVVFAARNVIDGIYANNGHGAYPYQSWGINRRPDAELRVDFGFPAVLDELVITLRADFPPDNYWTRAAVAFSGGGAETLNLVKSALPQTFKIAPVRTEWIVLKNLIKTGDESPFPALTQLEAWGAPQ